MNINRIENKELRNFIERNPEASFQDIVEFCRQKFDDAMSELSSSDTKLLQKELSSEDLIKSPSKLMDIIQPVARENQNRPHYNRLQDRAVQMARKLIKDIGALSGEHSSEIINSLKAVVHTEFDELAGITPNRRTELDGVYKTTNRRMEDRKEEKDSEDRRKTENLSRQTSSSQRDIMKDFTELSTAEQQNYGFTFERGRGVVQIRRVIEGVQSKMQQLSKLFKSSKDFIDIDVPSKLISDNSRVLEEVQQAVRECRRIIDEAVYQISKEQIEEEMRRDDQRQEDIRKKLEEEDKALEARRLEQKKEEEQYMARRSAKKVQQIADPFDLDDSFQLDEPLGTDIGTGDSFDIDADNPFDLYRKDETESFSYNFNDILISASDATREVLVNAGVPEAQVDAFVWDRYVRSSKLDRDFESAKITQKEYDRQLSRIDRIEELLFDGLVEGKTIDEARELAEKMAAREEHVGIIPSPETQKNLEALGMSSEDAKRYVWDGYVRRQIVDEAHEKGQITDEQKLEQEAKIDEITGKLADGLMAGRSFEEARKDAEVSTRKSAMKDISASNITMGQVQKANDFMQLEANPQSKEIRQGLSVDEIY